MEFLKKMENALLELTWEFKAHRNWEIDFLNKFSEMFNTHKEHIELNYVTQKEHIVVKSELEKLKDKLWNINFYIIVSVLWAVLVLIFNK